MVHMDRPLVLSFTVLGCVFDPDSMLDTFVPVSIWPLEAHHKYLLHQLAILYAFMAITFGVLLRASPDPKVWSIVQAGTLFVDVALVAAMYDALKQQGRLDAAKLRSGDWFGLVFTVWVALIRLAFLLGVGGAAAAKKAA